MDARTSYSYLGKISHIPYPLAHRTTGFYAVRTYRDMIGPGLILKGGLVTRCESLNRDGSI